MRQIYVVASAVVILFIYSCNKDSATPTEDMASAHEMTAALARMGELNDSVEFHHHHLYLHHHYDSLFHYHDSLYWHHHTTYHQGDTTHHFPTGHHTPGDHHHHDSIVTAHLPWH